MSLFDLNIRRNSLEHRILRSTMLLYNLLLDRPVKHRDITDTGYKKKGHCCEFLFEFDCGIGGELVWASDRHWR